MHCNNGLNNKLVESLVENKVAQETGDLKYLQDSMYDFVSTLKEIILGEYSPEFFNKYVDEALKLHGSNLEEFLKIPKMGLELRQALNSIDDAIDTSNQEFQDNLVLLLDRFQTTLDNIEYEARDPYDTAVELGFEGTKQEWIDHLEGDSAYEIAVKNGYEGTQSEWLLYIRADGFIQSIQQFATNNAETQVQIPDYGTINSLQGYIKEMFEKGGLPAVPFKDYNSMVASALPDDSYAIVTDSPQAEYNGLYLKTAGAWVKSSWDVYNKTINDVKTYISKYIKESINLYNYKTITDNKVIGSDGAITDNVNIAITDFIAIKPNQDYTILGDIGRTAFVDIALYDKNKVFIRRSASNNKATGIKAIKYTDSNAAYVRFNINKSQGLPDTNNRMFVEGDIRPDYVDGVPIITNVTLGEDVLQDLSEVFNLKELDSILDVKNNLFDWRKATEGYSILSDGTVSENENYSISDYIPVKAFGKYTISGQIGVDAFLHSSYYDKDKVFITRVTNGTASIPSGSITVTAPANAAYVRLNMHNGKPNERARMYNEGVEALPYDEGGVYLKDVYFDSSIINSLKAEIGNVASSAKYELDIPIKDTFKTDKVWSQYEGNWRRVVTSAEVYSMFDELQAARPTYIKKQRLRDDDAGNEISLYKFMPYQSKSGQPDRPLPKIFLTVGTHGYEQMPTLATYLLMKEVCENWRSDPLLELLRHNVEILIIPVVCPYGWDNFQRHNVNGVDINRNFPENHGWQSTDPSSPYYGGATPLSEPEAQNISQVLDENPDIDACYDFHNFGGVASTNYYIWLATNPNSPKVAELGQQLCNRMTRQWQKEYEWLPQAEVWFAGFSNETYGAMVQDHAAAKGVPLASTFEICEKWWLKPDSVYYDAIHCKTAVEAIANWLLINVEHLTK